MQSIVFFSFQDVMQNMISVFYLEAVILIDIKFDANVATVNANEFKGGRHA